MSKLKALRKRIEAKLITYLPGFIRIWANTWRVEYEGDVLADRGVLISWHGEFLACARALAFKQVAGLSSLSRDGNISTALLTSWGFNMIRGGSSKGGARALIELIRVAKTQRVAITPDGPRGPARVMKDGAVAVATKAGVDIYCFQAKAKFAIRGTRWDRFLLPLPFSRVHIRITRVPIPSDASRETIDTLNQRIVATLNQPW